MGLPREHTEYLFKNWVISDGVVAIQLMEKQCSVSATDIVRVEFKGYQKAAGVVVDAKPSDHLPVLRFNRFPEGDQWGHSNITLSPDNKEFDDIVLENVSEEDFKVIAEFVQVLQ